MVVDGGFILCNPNWISWVTVNIYQHTTLGNLRDSQFLYSIASRTRIRSIVKIYCAVAKILCSEKFSFSSLRYETLSCLISIVCFSFIQERFWERPNQTAVDWQLKARKPGHLSVYTACAGKHLNAFKTFYICAASLECSRQRCMATT